MPRIRTCFDPVPPITKPATSMLFAVMDDRAERLMILLLVASVDWTSIPAEPVRTNLFRPRAVPSNREVVRSFAPST